MPDPVIQHYPVYCETLEGVNCHALATAPGSFHALLEYLNSPGGGSLAAALVAFLALLFLAVLVLVVVVWGPSWLRRWDDVRYRGLDRRQTQAREHRDQNREDSILNMQRHIAVLGGIDAYLVWHTASTGSKVEVPAVSYPEPAWLGIAQTFEDANRHIDRRKS